MQESSYTARAEEFYSSWGELQGRPSEFSWDDKTAGAQLLMFQLTGENKYKENVQVAKFSVELLMLCLVSSNCPGVPKLPMER